MPRGKGTISLPQTILVGRADAARVIGIGAYKFDGHVERGELPQPVSPGCWDLLAVVKMALVMAAGLGARKKLDDERVRRLRLQNEKLEGSVVPIRDVLPLVEEMHRNLIGYEDGAAQQLAMDLEGVGDAASRKQLILKQLIDARILAYRKFSERLGDVVRESVGAAATDVRAEAAADAGSVGGPEPDSPEDQRGAGTVPKHANAVHDPADARDRRSKRATRHRRVRKPNGEDR